MSLILDALNRSERERDNESDIPGIKTQHTVEPLPQAHRWRSSLPWVGLILALCVIAWLLVDESREVSPPVVSSVAEQRSNPVAEVEPEPVTQAEAELVAEQMPKPVQQPEQQPSVEPLQPNPSASAVEDLYEKKTEEPVAVPAVEEKVGEQLGLVEETATDEQPIDIEKMIALARAEEENVKLAEHSVPFLSELSQRTKDEVPTIYYTQHDFSGNSGQSSVTLNGETLRVGSSMAGGGLKVDEILANSVVLNHRGTQFRLKALNSWINL